MIDRLARASSAGPRSPKKRFDGLTLDGNVELSTGGAKRCLLLKPLTYMNLSGQSVQAAMAFISLCRQDIMIVLDDLALPCGRLRLRGSGSVRRPQRPEGYRACLGHERVSATENRNRPRPAADRAARIMCSGRFTTEQRKLLEPAIDRAVRAILTWIEKGIESAMNQFNADEKKNRFTAETQRSRRIEMNYLCSLCSPRLCGESEFKTAGVVEHRQSGLVPNYQGAPSWPRRKQSLSNEDRQQAEPVRGDVPPSRRPRPRKWMRASSSCRASSNATAERFSSSRSGTNAS